MDYSEAATTTGSAAVPATVTLTLTSQTTQGNARTGESENHSTCTICLSGTVMQVKSAITELFDADRANGLHRELGLNATSASAALGQQ